MATGQSLENAIEAGNQGDRRSRRPGLSPTNGGPSHPRHEGVIPVTATQIVNRGYNLMITAFLFIIGLAMGSNAIPEGEFTAKLDDLGLLGVGRIAVV